MNERTRTGLAVAVLVAAVLAAAVHCVGWEYGADDVPLVRWYTELRPDGHVAVRWPAVLDDFAGPWGGNRNEEFWRPVVSLSLALDFAVFGLSAGADAAVNLLVHLSSTLVLYALARRILPGRRAALPAALLFGLTPLAHENIAWAVGRCGLTVLLGLASGLALVDANARGRRGLARHGLASVLLALDLATMESALFWAAFPPVCLLLQGAFHRPQDRLRPVSWAPYAVLAAGYLWLRLALFGSIAGGRAGDLFGGGPALLAAPFEALWASLVPHDETWLPRGLATSLHRALCLFPLVVGLVAPLAFRDPRSRAYRRALFLLLGFWLLTRLPTLVVPQLGPDLEGSRTAYYSYAPLALLTGLLASTVRYGRWACFVLAALFGANLHHRISERVQWAAQGRRARALVLADAAEAGAIAAATNAAPIALLNRIDGTGGAPVYHPGEMVYVLYPPFVAERVLAVSVHRFVLTGEMSSAAWIAAALRRLTAVLEPRSAGIPPRLEHMDPTRFVTRLPEGRLAPRLVASPAADFPDLELPAGYRDDPVHGAAVPVLLLAAGARNLALPLAGSGWPPPARAALQLWARLGGRGAPFACFVETRSDPRDPATARARSKVLVGYIR